MSKAVLSLCVCVVTCCISATAWSVPLKSGRAISTPEKEFSISFTMGSVLSIDGNVKETKRAGEEEAATASDSYYDKLEDYSLEELGFDESYGTLGINLEKQWKYLTLQTEFQYMSASGSGTAEREPFAIGVGEVEYEGKEYDYMLIPEGDSYDAELQGGLINLKALITPFHMEVTEAVSITPWIHVGLFSVLGYYEIDAGEPSGVTTYESHPHQYVVGGKGSGWSGLVIPHVGFGGEVKVLLGHVKHGDVRLAVQGDLALLEWAGSTSDIGASSRNEKDVDLNYTAQELRAIVEIPVSKGSDLLLGMSFRHLEADADVEAQDRTDEVRAGRVGGDHQDVPAARATGTAGGQAHGDDKHSDE